MHISLNFYLFSNVHRCLVFNSLQPSPSVALQITVTTWLRMLSQMKFFHSLYIPLENKTYVVGAYDTCAIFCLSRHIEIFIKRTIILTLQRFYKKAACFVLRAVAKHSPELAKSVVESGALEPLGT